MSRPLFNGQLQKKGKINTAWKLRWCNLCVLKSGNIVLEYYDSKMSRKLCGTIDLSQVFSIEVIAAYDLDLMKQLPENVLINTRIQNEQKYSFQVCTSNRKYMFAAFDPPSFFTWMNHLDKYIYGGIIKQGWMMKKGDRNRGWKRRYFVLNEYKQIKYYQDFERTSFAGTIHLHTVNSIANGKVYSDEYKFTFELSTDKRIWILCCKDLQQRQSWHHQIKQTIGATNLSNHLSPRTKHNVQIAHMKRKSCTRLQYLSNGTLIEMDESKDNHNNSSRSVSSSVVSEPDDICTSLRDCSALNRITMNLHFYQTMIEGNKDSYNLLLNYYDRNKRILDDYGHLLHHHLNDCNRIKSNETFEIITDTVRKYVQCHIGDCKQYQRVVRDRVHDIPHNDEHALFCIDLFDTMHCNFVHSFDIGARINTFRLSISAYIDQSDDDVQMSYIHNVLKIKRKTLWRSPPRTHKFCTLFSKRKARGSISVETEHKQMDISRFQDDYVKMNEIGSGAATAFGSTYLCHKMNEIDDIYAVKQMSKVKLCDIAQTERLELMQSMKNEIEMMRILKHDNIVELHEIYEDKNYLYLIMDRLQGAELLPRIYTLPQYTETFVANITQQILHALAYMQSNGICHFNIKPQHIMFESDAPDALVKIIDFGTAQIMPKMRQLKKNIGTSYYTAPEVLNGKYDRASDMWSVGVIVFCMLFGYPTFYVDENAFNYFGKKEEEEIFELIKKGFNPEIRAGYGPWFPNDVAVSEEARHIISGMLKHNVSDRLSVTECLEHKWIRNRGNHRRDSTSLPKSIIFNRLSNFVHTCAFKLMISKLFTHKLDSTNYAKTLQVFKQWDKDKDGEITLSEFKHGMAAATELRLTEHEMNAIFQEIDVKHDSRTISIDELIVSSAFNALNAVCEQMYELFCELDEAENGHIPLHELKNAVHDLDEEYMDEIIRKLDTKGSGSINYIDFMRAIHGQYNETIRRGTQHSDIGERYQFTDISMVEDMDIHVGIHPIRTKQKQLAIINENKEQKQQQDTVMKDNSFGIKCNYHNTDDEWYIKPKYADLKQEIVSDLGMYPYQYSLYKTEQFMKSEWVKTMKSEMDYMDNIMKGDAITLQHIFVVILYTDYTLLHNNVRLSQQETDESLKEKTSAYYYFCKLLYESVNIFGHNDNEYAYGYYHCVDRVAVPKSHININGIISVTEQLEIAIDCMAGNHMNGMILEFESKNGLNCNFLSWLSHENESILFAPSDIIRVHSICILLNDRWNGFRKYISAINTYDDILNGRPMIGDIEKKKDYFECIKELVEYELEHKNQKHSLLFVYKYFHLFCMESTHLIIDLQNIKQFYYGFIEHLVSSVNNPLLRFNEMVALFPHCAQITTQRGGGNNKITVSTQYFDELLPLMSDLNNHSNIKILTIINPSMQCTQNKFKSYKDTFKQKNWIINYDNNENSHILSFCKQ